MTKIKTPESFEEAIATLESLIKQIENNEVTLEQALEHYQYGMDMVKFCRKKLEDVEQKIKTWDPESSSLKDLELK